MEPGPIALISKEPKIPFTQAQGSALGFFVPGITNNNHSHPRRLTQNLLRPSPNSSILDTPATIRHSKALLL